MRTNLAAFVVLITLLPGAASFAADDFSELQVAHGMPNMGKGQWTINILEGGGGIARTGSICLEKLGQMIGGSMGASEPGEQKQTRCASRILENTPERGVVESACPEGTVRTTIMREGKHAFLMQADGTSHGQPVAMKARYAYEGPCKAGESPLGISQDSEQCQKMRAMASMDPAQACARAGAHQKMCEDQVRQSLAQLKAMCP